MNELMTPVIVRSYSPTTGQISCDAATKTPGASLKHWVTFAGLIEDAFVEEIRFRNTEIPVFLHGETRTSRHIPNDILRQLVSIQYSRNDTALGRGTFAWHPAHDAGTGLLAFVNTTGAPVSRSTGSARMSDTSVL